MITYRYVRNNDLSVGVLKIHNGIISTVPNCMENKDWAIFMVWYNESPFNRPQEAW